MKAATLYDKYPETFNRLANLGFPTIKKMSKLMSRQHEMDSAMGYIRAVDKWVAGGTPRKTAEKRAKTAIKVIEKIASLKQDAAPKQSRLNLSIPSQENQRPSRNEDTTAVDVVTSSYCPMELDKDQIHQIFAVKAYSSDKAEMLTKLLKTFNFQFDVFDAT